MQDKYKVLFILLLPSLPVPFLNLFLHKSYNASGNWKQRVQSSGKLHSGGQGGTHTSTQECYFSPPTSPMITFPTPPNSSTNNKYFSWIPLMNPKLC